MKTADPPRPNNTRSFRVNDLEMWERFDAASEAAGHRSRGDTLNQLYEEFTRKQERRVAA